MDLQENIGQDIVLLEDIKEDVYKKLANAQSSAGKSFYKYQMGIRLRFEHVLEGLKKITQLLVLRSVSNIRFFFFLKQIVASKLLNLNMIAFLSCACALYVSVR